jgi:hypothetical protein
MLMGILKGRLQLAENSPSGGQTSLDRSPIGDQFSMQGGKALYDHNDTLLDTNEPDSDASPYSNLQQSTFRFYHSSF